MRSAANDPQPIGQTWLRREMGLSVPPPGSESYLVAGARRTETCGSNAVQFYPRPYGTDSTVVGHLRFALKHEPLDLGILAATMKALDPTILEDWVRQEPTGGSSRRVWFFYELFTGRTLDVPDTRTGNYVEALDPTRHVVAMRRNSARHRVADNLLGDAAFCPTVRRTARLDASVEAKLAEEVHDVTDRYSEAAFVRAGHALSCKEIESYFGIEGAQPWPSRVNQFALELSRVADLGLTEPILMILLNDKVVDTRFLTEGWRTAQSLVVELPGSREDSLRRVWPRPDALPDLMSGWTHSMQRLLDSPVDAVIAAAVAGFAFAFIHPFDDGNDRIHRLLIHAMLAQKKFSPKWLVLPVSAAILRDRQGYDQALEAFYRPRRPLIDGSPNGGQESPVADKLEDLYRYFDATAQAEYLYDRVVDCVRDDLRKAFSSAAVFADALEAVRNIVDLPNRLAQSMVDLCLQNGGRFPSEKRSKFESLSDAEISAMGTAVRKAIDAEELRQIAGASPEEESMRTVQRLSQ